MYGLGLVDIGCLVLYLVGITALGVWSARLVRVMSDYFMPRRFGKPMMMMHAFGTGTASDKAVSVASHTYRSGLSGIWLQWLWLFCTPFYWLIAPVMRRFRAITTGDVFEARYDRGVAVLFAVVGILNYAVIIGTLLKGSGAIVSGCTGGAVDPNVAIIAMAVLFVIYGVAGGLSAAIVTDFIQGILTIAFSFLLLPFLLHAVGGLSGVYRTLPRPAEMFSLVAPGGINAFYIAVIAFNALVGIVAQPHTMGNCAAGRTEMDGRVGFMFGTMIKRVCTMAWCVTGLAAAAYFIDKNLDVKPDHVYGLIARDLLPGVLPGLLGIFIACVLASVMSSCDSFMVASAGLFTANVYKPLRPGRSERHYLAVGRITSLVVVASGLWFAYRLKGVVEGIQLFWKIAPMIGVAFWLGLFWRRATSAGAWAAALAGFATWWLATQRFAVRLLARLPAIAGAPFIVQADGADVVSEPWTMIFYLAAALLAGVVVSLLTKPKDREKLDAFYALVRTPVREGETLPAPCTLPEGAEVPPRRVLFPSSSFEIPIPTMTSIVGFLVGWLCVALLIGVFMLLVRV